MLHIIISIKTFGGLEELAIQMCLLIMNYTNNLKFKSLFEITKLSRFRKDKKRN